MAHCGQIIAVAAALIPGDQMKRLLACGSVIAAFVLIGLPSSARASSFTFGGGGIDGMFIWDDIADVGTMNNQCNASHPQCKTEALGPFTDGSEIVAQVVFDAPVEFSKFELFLLLTVDESALPATCSPAPAPPTAYHEITGPVCQSVADFKTNFPNDDHQDFNINPSPTGVPQGVAILPFVPTPGVPGILSGTLSLLLTDPSQDFLEANAALWATARAGFAVSFLEENIIVAIPFTASLGSTPAAVPEPTSLLLLGSGLAGAVARRYRRRTKTTAA
jgi:hypothetical protein